MNMKLMMKCVGIIGLLIASSAHACYECRESIAPEFKFFHEPTWRAESVPESREGHVTAKIELKKDGRVKSFEIVDMFPTDLDQETVEKAIKSARFEPGFAECESIEDIKAFTHQIEHRFDFTFERQFERLVIEFE